jgi:integrase
MAEPFEAFHHHLAKQDIAPCTKERYWQVVTSYRDWLSGKQPDVASAKDFLSFLREKGYLPRTTRLYYHILRIFFDFMGLALKDKLRVPRTLPPYYDIGDIEGLISQAEKGLRGHGEAKRKRNTAIIMLMAFAGLRRGEVASLRVSDLDFARQRILVRYGKGGKDRVVPMAERLIIPLREQCEGKASQQRVFDLSPNSIYLMVRTLAEACGLQSFHPHSLRHFFAVYLLERGATLNNLRELLGHDSIATTSIYLSVSPMGLIDTIALFGKPKAIVKGSVEQDL